MQEVMRAMSVGKGWGGTFLRNTVEVDLIIQCFPLKVTDEEFKVTLSILAQVTRLSQYQEQRKPR